MKITRKSAKRAFIQLLGGAVVVISLMLPKVANASNCPYYYQSIRCYSGHTKTSSIYCGEQDGNGWWGYMSIIVSNGYANNCVSGGGSGGYYASYSGSVTCSWTVQINACMTYGTPVTLSKSMSGRYCAYPCGG
jgi:hypothetical protein